jgi:hypothetical protein
MSPEIAVPLLFAKDLLLLRLIDTNYPMIAMGTAAIAAIHDQVSSIWGITTALAPEAAGELFLQLFCEQSY